MLRNMICIMTLLVAFAVIELQPLISAEPNDTEETKESGKIALSEVAPELYFQLRRYPKFYSGPNTVHGGLLERSFLLDDAGGARDALTDHGIYLDVSATQFFQGNVSGGKSKSSSGTNGTVDYWVTLDSGKAGLWSGGALFAHAESSWQADESINSDVGSLLPANYDAAMPTPGVNRGIVLPELYLVQALPADFVLVFGKVNFAGLGENNLFANNERTQFSYVGLVNNPILGAFIPYTPVGAALVWTHGAEHTVAILGVQAKGDGTTNGFDNFDGDFTFGVQYQFSPTLGGDLPGNYRVLVGYSNKDVTEYDIDPRHLIGEITGAIPIEKKSNNSAVLVNFDQYLWSKGTAQVEGRQKLPPVGIGIFGRAGWAPNDRNVIDQFYSFGIGGYGMVIPTRNNDQWGVGWSGTHLSSALRADASILEVDLDGFEHAFEAFYNFEVTPATHLTFNLQVVNSVAASVDTATTFGTRFQFDF